MSSGQTPHCLQVPVSTGPPSSAGIHRGQGGDGDTERTPRGHHAPTCGEQGPQARPRRLMQRLWETPGSAFLTSTRGSYEDRDPTLRQTMNTPPSGQRGDFSTRDSPGAHNIHFCPHPPFWAGVISPAT